MSVLIRTWLGIAALGAAIVHLGAASGLPGPALLLMAALSLPELAWSVVALAAARIPAPRLGIAAVVAPTLGWVALLLGGGHGSHAAMTTAGTDLPVEALLLGSLLGLAAAIGLAVVIRRGAPRRDAAAPSTWRYLGGVLAGCALVAGVTSSALGATPVGALAMQGMGMGH